MVYAANRERLFSEKYRPANTCTPQAVARLPHNSLTAAPLQLADKIPEDAMCRPQGSLQRVPAGRNAGNGGGFGLCELCRDRPV